MLYCTAFIEESLLPVNRKKFNISRNINPFRPLLHVADNPIVLWMSVTFFLISLPQSGVVGIILVYIADLRDINNDQDAAVVNASFLISVV